MPALLERHEGERGAVLLMVIIERVIPPGAVALLVRQQNLRQVILIERTIGGWQHAGAAGCVVVAEVVEVACDLEVRLMGDGPFAAHVEPAVARDQPIEPLVEHLVGNLAIAPEPYARLQACDRPRLPPGRLIPIIG